MPRTKKIWQMPLWIYLINFGKTLREQNLFSVSFCSYETFLESFLCHNNSLESPLKALLCTAETQNIYMCFESFWELDLFLTQFLLNFCISTKLSCFLKHWRKKETFVCPLGGQCPTRLQDFFQWCLPKNFLLNKLLKSYSFFVC